MVHLHASKGWWYMAGLLCHRGQHARQFSPIISIHLWCIYCNVPAGVCPGVKRWPNCHCLCEELHYRDRESWDGGELYCCLFSYHSVLTIGISLMQTLCSPCHTVSMMTWCPVFWALSHRCLRAPLLKKKIFFVIFVSKVLMPPLYCQVLSTEILALT